MAWRIAILPKLVRECVNSGATYISKTAVTRIIGLTAYFPAFTSTKNPQAAYNYL